MTSSRSRRRVGAVSTVSAVVAALLLLATACGGSSGDTDSSGKSLTKIKFALDWTPNTNHTGLYVAQQKGYFKAAGLDVEILPYNNSSPDTLVSAGSADFGISFEDSYAVSKAAGANITSVMAVMQHWGTAVAVKADSGITSPKQLDGTTYGGFGVASEKPKMKKFIQDAGGKGDFKTVVLGTSAYDALYSGKVQFTEPFITWEAIEAKLKNEPLTMFNYTDYGFPDIYGVITIGNSSFLKKNPAVAKKFVSALQKGYEYAADNPADAAQVLIKANPGAFTNTKLVTESQALYSKSYLKDASGKIGTQTLDMWTKYPTFLYDSGLLADSSGKKLTSVPDYQSWFTNQYLS